MNTCSFDEVGEETFVKRKIKLSFNHHYHSPPVITQAPDRIIAKYFAICFFFKPLFPIVHLCIDETLKASVLGFSNDS